MISCAAIQKLERYGALGLKRHSTEDFVSTSLKDARRANIYALTLQETWAEAAAVLRGASDSDGGQLQPAAAAAAASARFTDALVYALSFAVALTTQHIFSISSAAHGVGANAGSSGGGGGGAGRATPGISQREAAKSTKKRADTAKMHNPDADEASAPDANNAPANAAAGSATSGILEGDYAQALALLTLLKETTVAVSGGRALRSNASSEEFTRAVAHLLTSGTDLVLLLLASRSATTDAPSLTTRAGVPEKQQQLDALLAQALVLVAATAQMLRRVQAAYPVADLYHTRPCAALLKTLANKHRQQQREAAATPTGHVAAAHAKTIADAPPCASSSPLLALLHRYVRVCSKRPGATAAGLFGFFSLFQRLGLLHGALDAVTLAQVGGNTVQHWLSQLLSSTACNRATRYVVYFREDELRLMQHNVRQATEYALFTFSTTPPVDPGLVEPLLALPPDGAAAADGADVTHARAALTLAQWCVSAPFFFASFCQDESWASFAQEQRRLVLLQQSRARRGLERTSKRQQRRERAKSKLRGLDGDDDVSGSAASRSSRASASSGDSDTASQHSDASAHSSRSALLHDTASAHSVHGSSVGGSVTTLASRVSLLSTLSKHSAASYLSFLSVLRPSTAGTATGTGPDGNAGDEDGAAGGAGGAAADRQMHESEDGNTNLPLILLEQLTLGLHRFMEAYPAALLDAYGLRSVSWSSIARMFAVVEASLVNRAGSPPAITVPPPQSQSQQQQLFNLAQDLRYNKGMGYECLGLLFAKVVAPLLDLTPRTIRARPGARGGAADAEDATAAAAAATAPSKRQHKPQAGSEIEMLGSADDDEDGDAAGSVAGAHSDGDRTEEGFFANAAAAAATVGRAVLSTEDDASTRAAVEAALSTCLTAYETVAPQVVDMNLATILRLAARTAAAAAAAAAPTASPLSSATSSSWSSVLVGFVRDITARLGRSNDLPQLVDALLGRRDFAGAEAPDRSATTPAAADATGTGVVAEEDEAAAAHADADVVADLRALRGVFALAPVREAVVTAAGTSLDPESLLLHLSGIATELEEALADAARCASAAHVQRTLLALELMEALLAGVVPTSVSASAVLEQTTQLELLLTSSFMTSKERAAVPSRTSPNRNKKQPRHHAQDDGSLQRDTCALLVQHLVAIQQCRAVTQLCLQDLGTQQVHDYLNMLEEALWQLTSHVGHIVGSLTLSELQPLLDDAAQALEQDAFLADPSRVRQRQLLLPSLVLQRLSLARAVGAALGTQAGPTEALRELVAYLWDCLGHTDGGDDGAEDDLPLWLALQLTAQEWGSVVALGKEKHARASMMALLLRSAALPSAAEGGTATAWMSCCLHSIPGTLLRALVDAFVSLGIEDACDVASEPRRQQTDEVRRQWAALTTSLLAAYAAVGHNPYWPSLAMHVVRAVADVARTWKKQAKANPGRAALAASALLPLTAQLVTLLLCVLRSEPRANEVLRRMLMRLARESVAPDTASAPTLSRSGVSVAYVEAIKVPATTLSDISVPADLAALHTAATSDDFDAGVAALQALTFEEELRDLCAALFSPALVRHLFTLADLCDGGRAAAATASTAVTTASMQALAMLYQTAVGAAQASWRAKATNGSVEALTQTPAVVFLQSVAGTFHTRLAVADSASDVTALTAFLESFEGVASAASAAGEVEPHYLFVHIAALSTERGRAAPRAVGAPPTAGAPSDGVRSAPSALASVEDLWHDILRWCATAVMAAAASARGSGYEKCDESAADAAAEFAPLQALCVTLRLLVTQVWVSAQHKQQRTSRAGASSSGGSSNHHRHSGADAKRGREEGQGSPAATVEAGGPRSGMDAFVAELLTVSCTSGEDANSTAAAALRTRLADFFAASTPGERAAAGHPTAPAERAWVRLMRGGAEAGVCAAWFLWKLQSVSASLHRRAHDGSTAPPATPSRWEAFLTAYDGLQAATPSPTAPAPASVVTLVKLGDAAARTATSLRGLSAVLQVMAAEDAPPLLQDHMFACLASAIPTPSGAMDEEATMPASAVSVTAAELLVQLLGVRPRLPAVRLLPLAQRLLVWLSRALAGGAGGLGSLCIRVCAAVAAHPAVCKAAAAGPAEVSVVVAAAGRVGGGGGRHGRRAAGLATSPARDLLDHVWLLLFRLLEEAAPAATSPADAAGGAGYYAAASALSSRPLLRESEMIKLVLLLTKTWMRPHPHPQVLWSRPAMLPPLLCAVFTCVMRGMEAQTYTPRVLNVLASGLAAMAAHVDAATASEGDADADVSESDAEDGETQEGGEEKAEADPGNDAQRANGARRRRRLEGGKPAPAAPLGVPAHVKRAALAAATSTLFEVAHHYIHVFTTYSADMDFIFTDFLRVLGQHFLPTVARPPVAHRVGVRIGGTTRSAMSFADLAYVCLGSADSKSLLKQAALRMEEEAAGDAVLVAGNAAARGPTLTEGSRNIFRVE